MSPPHTCICVNNIFLVSHQLYEQYTYICEFSSLKAIFQQWYLPLYLLIFQLWYACTYIHTPYMCECVAHVQALKGHNHVIIELIHMHDNFLCKNPTSLRFLPRKFPVVTVDSLTPEGLSPPYPPVGGDSSPLFKKNAGVQALFPPMFSATVYILKFNKVYLHMHDRGLIRYTIL